MERARRIAAGGDLQAALGLLQEFEPPHQIGADAIAECQREIEALEARRRQEEEERQREEQARREREEAERRRREQDERRQREEDERRRKEETERQRLEEEARRQAEEDARRKAEAARRAEEEARRQAEEAKRTAAAEARRKAEEEAREKAAEEARQRQEEERRRRQAAEDERRRQEAEGFKQRAQDALQRGLFADALAALELAHRASPGHDTELSALAAEIRKKREAADAAERVRRSVERNMIDARASFERADLEEAARLVASALKQAPADQEALALQAKVAAAIDRRRREAAERRQAEAAVTRARRRFADGDHDGAVHILEEFTHRPLVQAALEEMTAERQRLLDERQALEARLREQEEARRQVEARRQEAYATPAEEDQPRPGSPSFASATPPDVIESPVPPVPLGGAPDAIASGAGSTVEPSRDVPALAIGTLTRALSGAAPRLPVHRVEKVLADRRSLAIAAGVLIAVVSAGWYLSRDRAAGPDAPGSAEERTVPPAVDSVALLAAANAAYTEGRTGRSHQEHRGNSHRGAGAGRRRQPAPGYPHRCRGECPDRSA